MTRIEFEALRGKIAVVEKELAELKKKYNAILYTFAAEDARMINEWLRNVIKQWTVRIVEPNNGWPEGRVNVNVLIPANLIQEFEINTGLRVHEDDKRLRGMCYARTSEKILTSTGGGYCVLKTPMLCSDLEWASICSGMIPEKFLNL